MTPTYTGRFAPSPTGPLHAGSMVAALASWLDARAHGGRWLVRIEDVDGPRTRPGAAEAILRQLADCSLAPDERPVWQSRRHAGYEAALDRLVSTGWAYPCACTRRELQAMARQAGTAPARHDELVYPGTCRGGLHGRPPRAMRVLAAPALDRRDDPLVVEWTDRRLGHQRQQVSGEVGDFVVRRADQVWAYQLAVVVDDAHQGVTDVVRGADLADNTARQIHLQRLLGLPQPRYLHTPVVTAPDGEKLSKQHGAAAVDTSRPLDVLKRAGMWLAIDASGATPAEWLADATRRWALRWRAASSPAAATPTGPAAGRERPLA